MTTALTNGAGRATVATIVGGFHLPPTVRKDFGNRAIWFDLITMNPAHPLTRKRLAMLRGEQNYQAGDDFDDAGRLREPLVRRIWIQAIAGWGTYGDHGEDLPILDEAGEVLECTADNAVRLFCDLEGGPELFALVATTYQQMIAGKVTRMDQEKNSCAPSPAPPTEARSRRTRSARKRAHA